jgi:Asp-tRNA(Asn)/Glu-tRNA(Gln) amidotransferase A subunit family amidase
VIAQLQRAYAQGQTTPIEVVEQALTRLRRWAETHWLISLDEEDVLGQAEASARRLQSGHPLSKLDGVPVAIKDQLDVRGQRTTCGTSFLHAVAAEDAEAVARLRRAGAILFGKTNLYELALGPTGYNPTFGSAQNPWDRRRDTGGSSSGSAAVVAAGVVPLALGSDLGGSLRIPAALCGVAALKPTYGRVPTRGLTPVAWSLEHVGPIAASIGDLALALEVLTPLLPRPLPDPVRIGICDEWWSRADSATAEVALAAVARLRSRNVIAQKIALPPLDEAHAIGSLTTAAEAAAAFWWARAQLSPAVRIPLAIGRAVSAVERMQTQRARGRFCRELLRVFEEVDVLATPTTDRSARIYRNDGAELDEAAIAGRIAFTMPFNLVGLPAVQVPCGFDREGMPAGLQIVGPKGADEQAMVVAGWVESDAEKRSAPRL